MLLLGCHTVFMFISHSSCERASHSSVFVYLLFHSAFTLFFAIVSVNVGQVCVYAWCVCGVPMLDGWRLFFVSEFYSYFIFADDCVIYQRVFSDRLLIVFYSIASMPWDGLSVCFKSDFFISFSLSLYLPLSRSIYLIDIQSGRCVMGRSKKTGSCETENGTLTMIIVIILLLSICFFFCRWVRPKQLCTMTDSYVPIMRLWISAPQFFFVTGLLLAVLLIVDFVNRLFCCSTAPQKLQNRNANNFFKNLPMYFLIFFYAHVHVQINHTYAKLSIFFRARPFSIFRSVAQVRCVYVYTSICACIWIVVVITVYFYSPKPFMVDNNKQSACLANCRRKNFMHG